MPLPVDDFLILANSTTVMAGHRRGDLELFRGRLLAI
jgi:hypothetical protein